MNEPVMKRKKVQAASSSSQQRQLPGRKDEHDCSSWNLSEYPYETDYNDHFETPLVAYQDVKSLIDWILASTSSSKNNRPSTLYDPYYCNGRTLTILRDELKYPCVLHERRDFYQDIRQNKVPNHDVFITNPPYSDQHKMQCLQFCFQQLRTKNIPFLLLMPSYVATKSYYRNCLLQNDDTSSNDKPIDHSSSEEDVIYLVPKQMYQYDHPENTGKDTSPFDSLWFCGIGKHRIHALQQYWKQQQVHNNNNKPTLAISLNELEQKYRVISFTNRPNPKQRRRRKKQQKQKKQEQSSSPTTTSIVTATPSKTKIPEQTSFQMASPNKQRKQMSKYRDEHGNRKRKRF